MAETEEMIVCRSCREVIPRAGGNCPHCGTTIWGAKAAIVLIILGLIIAGASLFALSDLWFFGVFGVLLILIGAQWIRGMRARVADAQEQV